MSTFKKLKPASTFEEQVKIIRRHGFEVLSEDEDYLISFLNHANYYRFSAYFLPFYTSEYKNKKVNIKRVIDIYHFDNELRVWMFETIGHIEYYLRTQIAYYISHKYHPEAYLDINIFDPRRHNHNAYLSKVSEFIDNNRDTPVVRHHNKEYGGHFPFWVIIEFFSAGMLSKFYDDLSKKDRRYISGHIFNTKEEMLRSWLYSLTTLRNKCAHYTRFYFWIFTSIPRNNINLNFKMDRSLFSQICVLKFLTVDKTLWNEQYLKLEALIEKYINSIDLAHIGFPENYDDLLR